MRYIDINKLREIMGEVEFNEWREKATAHLEEIRNMSHAERSNYFARNNDWTELYTYLSELSNHKCWYSESPEGSSEFEVDHFRPKNRSKNHDGSVILEDGYWWLTYNEANFRLTGSLVNRRRKDRFNNSEEVKGKGDYFPLDLENCQAAEPEGDLDYEIPLLIDPTDFHDITLITFDKDGKILPSYEKGSDEYTKACVSIDFLGLDHTPLNRQRKEVWDRCDQEIKKASGKMKGENNVLKQKIIKDALLKIKCLTLQKQPYSAVAINCVISNSIQHTWLKPIVPHLG